MKLYAFSMQAKKITPLPTETTITSDGLIVAMTNRTEVPHIAGCCLVEDHETAYKKALSFAYIKMPPTQGWHEHTISLYEIPEEFISKYNQLK